MDILQMSVSATVLIVAVVIIRALALHKLPPRTFLALWGIVICRLLIPFSIPSRFSAYTALDVLKSLLEGRTTLSSPVETAAIQNMTNMPGTEEATGIGASAAASVSLIEIVWLAGMCVCVLLFIVTYIKCHREFRTSLPVENDFVTRWLREHSLRRPVQIRQSDRIEALLTYGVLRPVILFPKKTDWTDETRLQYVLAHEFTHIRRFDTLAKLVLSAAVCVHWFNPFVWAMYALANRDIELSCDETVVRTFGEAHKSAYAMTLIGLEEKRSKLTPLVNNFSKNAIEERIVSIMKIKKRSRLGILLALILVLGTAVFFSTSSNASVHQNSTEQSSETEDAVLHYETPGTPGNHSGYTAADYETLMALKTDDYRQMTTQDFLDILQKKNIDMVYTGYNPNDENVDFLKTLEYSCAELYAQLDVEYGQTSTTPYVSISTASTKENSDGEYYGAELAFSVFWTGTERLTVGDRDDTLNTTLEQIQEILEQKDQSQIGNTEDLNADFQELAEQMSSSTIKLSIRIDEYKADS